MPRSFSHVCVGVQTKQVIPLLTVAFEQERCVKKTNNKICVLPIAATATVARMYCQPPHFLVAQAEFPQLRREHCLRRS